MQIVLIGMMCSGKTTVGESLAKKLKKSWFDSDIEIEKRHGKIADIFQQKGERYFRSLEEEYIEDILNTHADCVLSTGGGSILSAKVCKLLQNCTVFFLQTQLIELQKRLNNKQKNNFTNRPLAKNLEQIYQERYTIYKQTANNIVQTDNKSISSVVQEILNNL